MKTLSIALCIGLWMAVTAYAQPLPQPQPQPEPQPEPLPQPQPEPEPRLEPDRVPVRRPEPVPEPVPVRRPEPEPEIERPDVIVAPTGRLLPAGILYSRTSLDTSGGFSSDARVGLGDVAEFGLASTDLVRARRTLADPPDRVWPYLTAIFKMGVAENRLFQGHPAVALGFRKSFERTHDGFTTRIAELHLAASLTVGNKVVLHGGGVFWDASLQRGDEDAFTLHDKGWTHQMRGFGGLELKPLVDAQILLDVYWVPEFRYEDCDRCRIRLEPVLAWGVRYQAADGISLESGVRVQSIGEANLLDAQIFGQATFVSRRLRRAIEKLRR